MGRGHGLGQAPLPFIVYQKKSSSREAQELIGFSKAFLMQFLRFLCYRLNSRPSDRSLSTRVQRGAVGEPRHIVS